MADKEINTEGGTFVGKDVDTGGGSFTGRDAESRRQSMTTFIGTSEGMQNQQLWWEFMKLAQQVLELKLYLDDVPNRVARLERLEVVVRPAAQEVVIRPLPDTPAYSFRFVLWLGVGLAVLVLVVMGVLLYVQLR